MQNRREATQTNDRDAINKHHEKVETVYSHTAGYDPRVGPSIVVSINI